MSIYPKPVPDYPAAFERAVSRILADEGGYVSNPDDPGGETKFGICKREYPALDIKSLTREQAEEIYFRDWWLRFNYQSLPGPIGIKTFDLAVNMGPDHAALCLQRALRACGHRIDEDGTLGPQTCAAAKAANQMALMAALRAEAAGYYRALALEPGNRAASDRDFLEGWLNRAYE